MKAATILLVLASGLAANAQLNFEGNPLTDNTEYTAEESRLSRGTAWREVTATNATNDVPVRSQELEVPLNLERSRLFEDTSNGSRESVPKNASIDDREEVGRSPMAQSLVTVRSEASPTARHLSNGPYVHADNPANPAELALNTFLNSRTPEESRLSLDSYLQTRETPPGNPVREQTTSIVNQQQLTQQPAPQSVSQIHQQSIALSSPVNQHLTAQLAQQRQMLQAYPVNHKHQFSEQVYNAPTSSQDFRSPAMFNVVDTHMGQQTFTSYAQPGIQSRNDMFYPAGWHHRVRRIRGRPFPYAQPKGGPGFYNGPVPVPFKTKPPVEVIYTRPPGFGRGPPAISNPPVPYEDASAWFPEVDHPPPSKDVYYSQLYAQSYDPHYYNYIAKTGKVKPHRGFKKHGLKNMMTPTFLLGMTLPVVTLMLTALVQKRSFARSDSSREFSREETIQEYLEQRFFFRSYAMSKDSSSSSDLRPRFPLRFVHSVRSNER